MVAFSRLGLAGMALNGSEQPQEEPGEIKLCLMGFMLSTDSPKLLLISFTCGILTVGLLSRASRTLMGALYHKSRNWLAALLVGSPVSEHVHEKSSSIYSHKNRVIVAVPSGLNLICSSSNFADHHIFANSIRTGREFRSGTVTAQFVAGDGDLFASYKILDLPKRKLGMRDVAAQTSLIPETILTRSLSVGSQLPVRGTHQREDRACSPIDFSLIPESSSPEELIMFDKEFENAETVLDGDSSELYDKLAFIQKALQEATQEMDTTMSSLCELSQRQSCSTSVPSTSLNGTPKHTPRYPESLDESISGSISAATTALYHVKHCQVAAAPFSCCCGLMTSSSSDFASGSGLVWEDEFNGDVDKQTFRKMDNNKLELRTNGLALWESELRFYSGLRLGFGLGPRDDCSDGHNWIETSGGGDSLLSLCGEIDGCEEETQDLLSVRVDRVQEPNDRGEVCAMCCATLKNRALECFGDEPVQVGSSMGSIGQQRPASASELISVKSDSNPLSSSKSSLSSQLCLEHFHVRTKSASSGQDNDGDRDCDRVPKQRVKRASSRE